MRRSSLPALDVTRSFAGKITILLLIFLVFPVLVYIQLAAADRTKNELLMDSIQREGELIVRALRPVFTGFETVPPDDLQGALDRLRTEDRNIKLLMRPEVPETPSRFYYIAASPKVTRQRLDEERTSLLATGILDRLAATCEGRRPLATRFVNPDGETELLSALVPIQSGETCFVIITSHTGSGFLETALGRPFWRTETLQVAAIMYAVMAALVVWLFADAWHNLQQFRATARTIRIQGPGAGSFAMRNRIPELSTVAEDIDRLVEDLDRSRRFIRDAAEETAHDLKAPLAVIAQALEPLKRSVAREGSEQSERCVALIESAVARSDAMITATRDLERLVAETLERGTRPVDLGALLGALGSAYDAALEGQRIDLDVSITGDLRVVGSEEALETVFENILENAASFSPSGSKVTLTAFARSGWAVVEIADDGPGVDPKHLETIFERYVSLRETSAQTASRQPATSFGLGLWIVRRNVEALGGHVRAENRLPNGLLVTVSLPLTHEGTR